MLQQTLIILTLSHLSVSVLTYCQVHRIPCVMYVCFLDTLDFGVQCMKEFHKILQKSSFKRVIVVCNKLLRLFLAFSIIWNFISHWKVIYARKEVPGRSLIFLKKYLKSGWLLTNIGNKCLDAVHNHPSLLWALNITWINCIGFSKFKSALPWRLRCYTLAYSIKYTF